MKFISYVIIIFITSYSTAQGNNRFPAQPCDQAWEKSRPDEYLFNYARDTQITQKGNEGYSNYLTRLKKAGLIERKNCYKAWTVLVSMTATPDLIPYAQRDLSKMELGRHDEGAPTGSAPQISASSLKSDVLVQLNQIRSTTVIRQEISRYHLFQTPNQPLSGDLNSPSHPPEIFSPLIELEKEIEKKTEKDLLQDFLKWAIEHYPSEHYLLILWGHGQGWTASSHQAQSNQRLGGVGLTGSSDYLDIPTLRNILEEFKNGSNGEPIDVFATDACLMQSTEDVSHLSKCARYICGSEDTASYAGFPYGSLLVHLNSDGSSKSSSQIPSHDEGEPYEVAWMMPHLIKQSFEPQHGSQWDVDSKACRYLTSCSISTHHFNRSLLPALGDLGTALIKFIEEDPGIRFLNIKETLQKGPFFPGGTQDLGVVLENLENGVVKAIQRQDNHGSEVLTLATSELLNQIKQTKLALQDCVISSAMGTLYDHTNAQGLSIWIPEDDSDYHKRIDDYSKSELYKQAGWKALMSRMYPKTRNR